MGEVSNLRLLFWPIGLAMLLALDGCGTTKSSAPIRDYSPAPDMSSGTVKPNKKKKVSSAEAKSIRSSALSDRYRVKPGDTLYSISIQFGVDYKELARFNGVDDNNVINIGQLLKIPKASTQNYVKPKTVDKVEKPAAKSVASPSSWRWPTGGSLDYRFMKRVSERGKGIGIRVTKETPVYASAPGKVVYSGSGLRGYGKLLIIKHDEDFLSVYAHNSQLLSSEGQFIAQGQQVAIVGGTGFSDTLHFEVRLKGKPVDPLKYLPKR